MLQKYSTKVLQLTSHKNTFNNHHRHIIKIRTFSISAKNDKIFSFKLIFLVLFPMRVLSFVYECHHHRSTHNASLSMKIESKWKFSSLFFLQHKFIKWEIFFSSWWISKKEKKIDETWWALHRVEGKLTSWSWT